MIKKIANKKKTENRVRKTYFMQDTFFKNFVSQVNFSCFHALLTGPQNKNND